MAFALNRSLFWRLFLPVGVVLIVSGGAAALLLPTVLQRNAEHEAVEAAQATVHQFLVLRKYYTEHVASKILSQGVLKVGAEHETDPKMVPLPATLVFDLSELLRDSGTTLKLYSPYPFPNRRERQTDQFGQEAWRYLQANPTGAFYRTESVGGRTTVRVALADRMTTQACIACHNTLSTSPKKDWKLGDVRGVLEVDSSREVSSAARSVALVLATLGVILTLTALFLRVFYQRNVARPLHDALGSARALTEARARQVEVVRAIANGELEREFAPAPLPPVDPSGLGQGEVGELLQSVVDMGQVQRSFDEAFAKMTSSLRANHASELERDWLRSGQNDLNNLMRGEQDLDQLADRVLAFLVEHLGAVIGVLYVADDSSQQLRRAALYGLAQGTHPDAVGPDDGVIGQAVRSRKVIQLGELPLNYLPVASALGAAEAASVVVVPLVHGENLVGALELGAFQPLAQRALDFIELVREGVAIGLEVNLARERTRALLAETAQQAAELRAQQEELQQINAEIEERAELLELQREEIRAKNVAVEQANRDISAKAEELARVSAYKSEFLANMSHELRTPLNSMLILSSLLKENKAGRLDAKQVEYAQTIHSAGKDLLNLINDILDLSKVESGAVEFAYVPTVMDELCAALTGLFQPLADQKGLSMQVGCEPGVPETAMLDAKRVQQVLKNLLSNALKFTQRGAIALRISMLPAQDSPLRVPALAFAVSDTGIGVPLDKQNLIFEAFKQADGGISRTYGGTGLGLSISLQLARKMGGDLQIESREGEGSTFTLFLPLEPAPPPPRPRAQPQPPARSVTAEDDRQAAASGRRAILIIEDDRAFAGILRDFVRARGYAAIVAHDGEQGCALATEFMPHAVLLDVLMAHPDGWEVMTRLKANPRTSHIPVHFISCLDEYKRAMDMGAVGCVTKPVTQEQLNCVFDTIEGALARTARRVLVVEDSAAQLESLAALMSSRDVDVTSTQTGRDALTLLDTEHFDCLVLDLGLSDMSGYDVLSHLQSTPELRRLPVVIHTGQDLSREQQRQLNRYAKSIIIKGDRSADRLLDEIHHFLERVDAVDQAHRVGAFEPDRSQTAGLAGLRVLVVDDDMRNLFSLTSLLSDCGVEVIGAENGQQALDRLAEQDDIDCVLMDVMMPQMDGYEATRQIRRNPRFKDLPIIAMTAKAMQGDRQKCLEAGASDYIAKPVDTSQLLAMLRSWSAKRETS